MDYGILLTNEARLNIIGMSQEGRPELLNFFDYLYSGEWETKSYKKEKVKIWKQTLSDEYLFSLKIYGNVFAVWDVLKTIKITEYLEAVEKYDSCVPNDYLKPFVVIYSIGTFLGNPQELLLKSGKIPYSPFNEHKIPFLINSQLEENQLSYDEELYILGKKNARDFILGLKEGLGLHLTSEQAQVLGFHMRHSDQPLLLCGEAGSGKTVVMTHWLIINVYRSLKEKGEIPKQLFVTFSKLLVDKTKREFEQMVVPKYRDDHNVEFITYRELLWEKIVNFGGLRTIELENEMTFERFMREYSKRIPRNLDPILVWDEIRSVIKGSTTDGKTGPLISLEEYKRKNEERGQCKVPEYLREPYYEAALAYQKYLEENNLWDSLDLARQCVDFINSHKEHSFIYDKIACDEVQDLSPIEIKLLILLLKDNNINNIFITGDAAQVINPSGFTWRNLKGLLGRVARRTGIKDQIFLKRNFRCSKEIVNIVNKTLEIREHILQDIGEKNKQVSFKETGVLPMLLKENPLEILKKEISNPQTRMILVKNNKEKQKLEAFFKDAWTTRQATILRVEEAKGLEWDSVLLYNFFIPRHEAISKNDWEDVFIPAKRRSLQKLYMIGKRHKYALSYEFNLLHVALTRAKEHLFIYDDDERYNLLNLSQEYESLITPVEDVNSMIMKWRTESPTAKECEDLARRLLEKDSEQANLFFREAASIYQQEGNYFHAAECYEKAKEYALAAECHRLRNDKSKELEMKAFHFRKEGLFEQEGDLWRQYAIYHKLKDIEENKMFKGFKNAEKAFRKIEKYELAAKVCEDLAEYHQFDSNKLKWITSLGEAAEYLQKAGDTTKALDFFSKIIKNKDVVNFNRGEFYNEEQIEKWFAKKLISYSNIMHSKGNIKDAALIIMDASKMWNSLAVESEDPNMRNQFLQKQFTCIKQAASFEMQLEAFEPVKRYWREFLKILKEFGAKELCLNCYDEFIELYKFSGEVPELMTLFDEVYECYLDIGRTPETLLINNREWFKKKQLFEQEFLLLEKLREFYRQKNLEQYIVFSREAIELANYLDDYETAVKICLDLGFIYINKNRDEAIRMFENGLDILRENDLGDLNLGVYCFKRVAIDKFVVKDVLWNCYKDNWSLDQVIKWINRSVKYFSKNPHRAFKKLKKFKSRKEAFRYVWAEYAMIKLNLSEPLINGTLKNPFHLKQLVNDSITTLNTLYNYFEYSPIEKPSIINDITKEIVTLSILRVICGIQLKIK